MAFYENIKKRREELGITQDELAHTLGYKSRSTISKIESGENDVSQSKLKAIADALHTTPGRLMVSGDDPHFRETPSHPNIRPITTKRIPLVGEISCGHPVYADQDRESYIEVGTDIKADFCLVAKGDSMIGARIHDGDIVFIRAQASVNNGEIAAVVIEDEATLKRVFYQDGKRIILQAENTAIAPIIVEGSELDRVHIIGRAIAFQSDVI